ncbi:transglycosylase SLT domain-containing protein [Gluconobacter wancherniae]|uniref:transglycosylase SLT domain-containing protein n=1 Tax=Gluconobacter wancherniae TaxID=1307955 RepID=UPI001B8AB860|nr:transglycosylase SLT domain-containing protein [Gluconobacter wancherniae]MBS1094468.1 transglycosylase SLT domain-containing protein [Gluconobacter wancherniae]
MRRMTPFISNGTGRALLVSAMILAGATFVPARAQSDRSQLPNTGGLGDETAFAEVRPSLGGDGVVALPHPLSAVTASRYRSIFLAQRRGDLSVAKTETSLLIDRTLLGDVLADRYLAPAEHPTVAQLRDWLRVYSNSPDAPTIQKLLLRIAPAGSVQAQSFKQSLTPQVTSDTVRAENSSDPLQHAFARNPLLDRTVQERALQGTKGADSALHLVDATPGMTASYAAELYGEISLSLLSQGQAQVALRQGCAGFRRGDRQVGLPAYVAGLAAWRSGHMEAAYELFESAANAPITTPEIQAAAAYWAARAEGRRHAVSGYVSWLHRAAGHHETFYGMLATQTLEAGRHGHAKISDALTDVTLHDPVPVLGEIDVEAVNAMPQGRQLFGLLQIGEQVRAEALLRRMWPDVAPNAALARSLQLVAQTAGFQDLSEQMAGLLENQVERPVVAKALPLPRLRPNHGFRMDPALVYALTRVESNFDPAAASGAGAHGLMQIRPVTASFVTARHISFDTHGMAIIPVPPDMVSRLHNPSANLEIGQLYVLYLAEQSSRTAGASRPEGGDLVRVLASYNAGPGAIARWESAQNADSHDPLYFMETLPNNETRDYVHHALTYTWLYAHKMGLSSPSLKALSRSEWPSFSDEEAMAHEHLALN